MGKRERPSSPRLSAGPVQCWSGARSSGSTFLGGEGTRWAPAFPSLSLYVYLIESQLWVLFELHKGATQPGHPLKRTSPLSVSGLPSICLSASLDDQAEAKTVEHSNT